MATFTVWSLDVWGHVPSECCQAYDCKCVVVDDDGSETHDDDRCECHCEVNDRSRVGAVDIPRDSSCDAILRILDDDGFIHADKCVVDDYGDGSAFGIDAKDGGRPLLSLECDDEV